MLLCDFMWTLMVVSTLIFSLTAAYTTALIQGSVRYRGKNKLVVKKASIQMIFR